jgi:hypothetical protein
MFNKLQGKENNSDKLIGCRERITAGLAAGKQHKHMDQLQGKKKKVDKLQ